MNPVIESVIADVPAIISGDPVKIVKKEVSIEAPLFSVNHQNQLNFQRQKEEGLNPLLSSVRFTNITNNDEDVRKPVLLTDSHHMSADASTIPVSLEADKPPVSFVNQEVEGEDVEERDSSIHNENSLAEPREEFLLTPPALRARSTRRRKTSDDYVEDDDTLGNDFENDDIYCARKKKTRRRKASKLADDSTAFFNATQLRHRIHKATESEPLGQSVAVVAKNLRSPLEQAVSTATNPNDDDDDDGNLEGLTADAFRSNLSGVYFHLPKREWRAVIGRGNRRQQKTFSVRKYGFWLAKRQAEYFRTQFDVAGFVFDSRRSIPALDEKQKLTEINDNVSHGNELTSSAVNPASSVIPFDKTATAAATFRDSSVVKRRRSSTRGRRSGMLRRNKQRVVNQRSLSSSSSSSSKRTTLATATKTATVPVIVQQREQEEADWIEYEQVLPNQKAVEYNMYKGPYFPSTFHDKLSADSAMLLCSLVEGETKQDPEEHQQQEQLFSKISLLNKSSNLLNDNTSSSSSSPPLLPFSSLGTSSEVLMNNNSPHKTYINDNISIATSVHNHPRIKEQDVQKAFAVLLEYCVQQLGLKSELEEQRQQQLHQPCFLPLLDILSSHNQNVGKSFDIVQHHDDDQMLPLLKTEVPEYSTCSPQAVCEQTSPHVSEINPPKSSISSSAIAKKELQVLSRILDSLVSANNSNMGSTNQLAYL